MAKRKKQEEDTSELTGVEAVEAVEAVEVGAGADQPHTTRPGTQHAQTVVLLDPYEIQAPVELNTRRFQTSRESIVGLAMSMLEDGQQEPVKVMAAADGDYQLIWGYRRWQAATLINEEHLSEVPFRLQAIVVPHEDSVLDSWVVAGVVENTQRVGLGPLDEAYAIQKLKEGGLNQSAIARKMGVSQATITMRLKLLELPAVVQKRVNKGEVPVEPALLALGLPEGVQREEAIKALTARPAGRAKREVEEEDAVVEGDSGEVVKPVKPKTAKKMLAELEEYATPTDDTERTKAQTWILTKLIPWVKNPKRKFQKVMEALEELGLELVE